jgi:DNA-binding IclR family transcriptional regulator
MSTSANACRPSVVDRVFDVLESCAGSSRSLTLVDLVARTGLPKSTVHRVCRKLVELGMLSHDAAGFRIGTRLFALGNMNADLRRLRAIAMPHLYHLVDRTGWTATLAVADGDQALIIEELGVNTATMSAPSRVGERVPLYATAVGKALLANFDQADANALLGERLLTPYTPTTVVRPNLLLDQLGLIRQTGVAFSHEEWTRGTSAVASPVFVAGELIAAVAAVGPPGESGLRQRAELVRATAHRLGTALHPTPTIVAVA